MEASKVDIGPRAREADVAACDTYSSDFGFEHVSPLDDAGEIFGAGTPEFDLELQPDHTAPELCNVRPFKNFCHVSSLSFSLISISLLPCSTGSRSHNSSQCGTALNAHLHHPLLKYLLAFRCFHVRRH